VALPGTGPYSVSKFAVEAYCDVLRSELSQFGVSVSILEPGFFRTPMTVPERVCRQIDVAWERLPADTKEEYGEEMFRHAKLAATYHLTEWSSDRVELVVDAYYHALTSIWPRKRYAVGWDARFIYVPSSVMPTWGQDLVLQGVGWAMGQPKTKIMSY